MTTHSKAPHRVVVVGGGFAGLQAVRRLRRASVDVTLIDRRNFHLFQPLLYQVATGALSAGEIASPLRAILKHQRNARVVLGEVTGRRRAVLNLRGLHLSGTPAWLGYLVVHPSTSSGWRTASSSSSAGRSASSRAGAARGSSPAKPWTPLLLRAPRNGPRCGRRR